MATAESGRIRGKYESEDMVKEWGTLDPKDPAQLKKCLAEWMRDMKAWGSRVRDDVIRLEGAVRLAPGEPGDPPPAPKG